MTDKKIIELILSHLVFNEALKLYFKKNEPPSKDEIIKIMEASRLCHIDSESTYQRRSSTISSWMDWILNQIEE